ncbi:MAG: energy-coupling factor transporter ATPase [Acidaminococcales bacterium]|jgi:energy-coupling factor transport system ATP-binding protein|nr:energy-coupling factor transporter ATPase [Acidaminococcales bacterium]
MRDYIIVAENLAYSYKTAGGVQIDALSGVSLKIARGEFVAVVGVNGSGKSTLAKHFNALILPQSGKCAVCGYDCADSQNALLIRQNVGMVFQNPDNQIVAAIVEEDVAFGPENIGMPPELIRERVRFALAAVGMEGYRRQAPHMLSGGQKQRVAIAGVLALQPSCMVLDEPTAMLDPLGRREVLSAVLELNRQKGITIVYITHFMQEAAMADRIIVMDGGRAALEGRPKEVFCQAEKLKTMGLGVPLPAEIAWRLRKKGVLLPPVVTEEELAEALCR